MHSILARYFAPVIWLGVFLRLANSTAAAPISENATPTVVVNTAAEPITPGIFAPTWESLKQYECPEWFRDAKFGIWSVWGPQAVPEQGDWYARNMYIEGSRQNRVCWSQRAMLSAR